MAIKKLVLSDEFAVLPNHLKTVSVITFFWHERLNIHDADRVDC